MKKLKNFGEAIEALYQGAMIRRANWAKGTFVFMQVPSTIPSEVVPRMQSLPDSVKAEFERRFNDKEFQIDAIYYSNQLAIVDVSNLIVGYSPSVEDALAPDWIILD